MLNRLWQKGMRSIRTRGLFMTLGCAFHSYVRYPLLHRGERVTEAPAPDGGVRFHIVVPVYNTAGGMFDDLIASILGQTYAGWQLHLSDGGSDLAETLERLDEVSQRDARIHVLRSRTRLDISENTNAALAGLEDGYIVFCDHDDRLAPDALKEMALAIARTGADFLYSDEDLMMGGWYVKPHYKPDFSPDRLRSNNYICHLVCVKASLLREVGLLNPAYNGSQDHDLVLRLSEHAQRIAHVPKMLYHWRQTRGSTSARSLDMCLERGRQAVQDQLDRLGERGTVTIDSKLYRCKYDIDGTPTVSVVLYAEQAGALSACLDALRGDGWPALETILVGPARTGVSAPEARIVGTDAAAGCYAALAAGAQAATGEYLLFLDASVTLAPGCIRELLMHAQRAGRGAICPLLLYSRTRVATAGYFVDGPRDVTAILGPKDRGRYYGLQGFGGTCSNVLAAPRACLMMRADRYQEAGGFSAGYRQDLGDIDLCLRMDRAGLLHVYTPYARAHIRHDTRALLTRSPGDADAERFLLDWPQPIRDRYRPALWAE